MVFERRIFPRVEVRLGGRMQLAGSEQLLDVTISNLSVTGAAVETEAGPEPGDRLPSLRFDLPALNAGSGEPERLALDLEARVSRRITVAPQPGEKPSYILGLEFQGLDEGTRRLIHRFVFQRMMDRSSRPNADDPGGRKRRIPYRQPITLSYDWFGEFETQLTENLSIDGIFIRSSKPYPPGTVFDFQLLLRDDFTLVKGRGEVIWIREREVSPNLPAGMGIRFLDLDESGREVIRKVVEHHIEEERRTGGGEAGDNRSSPLGEQRPQDLPAVPVRVEPSDPDGEGRSLEHPIGRGGSAPDAEILDLLAPNEEALKFTICELRQRVRELENRISEFESPRPEPTGETQTENKSVAEESPQLSADSRQEEAPRNPVSPTEEDPTPAAFHFEPEPIAFVPPAETGEDNPPAVATEAEAETETEPIAFVTPTEHNEDDPPATEAGAEPITLVPPVERGEDDPPAAAPGAPPQAEPDPIAFVPPIKYGYASRARRSRRPWFLAALGAILALAVWFTLEGGLPFVEAFPGSRPGPATAQPPEPESRVDEPTPSTPPERQTRAASPEQEVPPVQTAPPEPPMVEPPPLPEDEIVALVEAWADAWASQRSDEYLAFYSGDFETPDGLGPEEWRELRRARVESPEYIEIAIEGLEVSLGQPGRATASFLQSYSRPGYSDQAKKLLVLERLPEGWRILSERSPS